MYKVSKVYRYQKIKKELNPWIDRLLTRQTIIVLIGLILLWASKESVNNFIGWLFELPFLKDLDFSDIYIQVLVLFSSLVIIVYQCTKLNRNYKFSFIQHFYLASFVLFGIFFRGDDNSNWVFTPLFSFDSVYLIDILVLEIIVFFSYVTVPSKYWRKIFLSIRSKCSKLIERCLTVFTVDLKNHANIILILTCLLELRLIHLSIQGVHLNISDFISYWFVSIIVFYLLLLVLFGAFKFVQIIRAWLMLEIEVMEESGEVKTDSSKFFLEDRPIGCDKNKINNSSYEKLGGILANKLTSQIFDDAFTVGIVGPWGSGKTSFINHVLKQAQGIKCKGKDIEVIRFNPAYNHSPEQIINDFFSTLIDHLKKYDGRLKSTLLSYSLKMVEAAINKKRDLQTILSPDNYIMRKRPVYKLYEDLSDIIEGLPVKPIIIIDDLDRLKPDEILEVLRIVRNTANFPNTVFMVAFDKGYVVNALANDSEGNYRDYIEKYFQLEFFIPHPKLSDLRHDFINCFPTSIENVIVSETGEIHDVHQQLVANISSQNNTLFDDFITNRREVVKLFNQFYLYVEILKHRKEVDYVDLFHFTLLKINYPSVISYLYYNLSKFFNLGGDAIWALKIEEKDSKKIVLLNDYFDNNFSTYNLKKVDLDQFYKLIIAMFGYPIFDSDNESSNETNPINGTNNPIYISNKELSIANAMRTDLYFNLTLSEDDIPLSQFYNFYINKSFNEFKAFIIKLTGINDPENFNFALSEKVVLKLGEITYYDIKRSDMIEKVILCAVLYTSLFDISISNLLSKLVSAKYLVSNKVFNQHTDVYNYVINLIEKLELSNSQLFDLLFDIYNIRYSGDKYVEDFENQWGESKSTHRVRLQNLSIMLLEESPIYNQEFFMKLEFIFVDKNQEIEKLRTTITNDEKLFADFLKNQMQVGEKNFYSLSKFTILLFTQEETFFYGFARALNKYTSPVFIEYRDFVKCALFNKKIHSRDCGSYYYFNQFSPFLNESKPEFSDTVVYLFDAIKNQSDKFAKREYRVGADYFSFEFVFPYLKVRIDSSQLTNWDEILFTVDEFNREGGMFVDHMISLKGNPKSKGEFLYIENNPIFKLVQVISPKN